MADDAEKSKQRPEEKVPAKPEPAPEKQRESDVDHDRAPAAREQPASEPDKSPARDQPAPEPDKAPAATEEPAADPDALDEAVESVPATASGGIEEATPLDRDPAGFDVESMRVEGASMSAPPPEDAPTTYDDSGPVIKGPPLFGGKTSFPSFSFDVKVEGKNVVRHLDLTTQNQSTTQTADGGTDPTSGSTGSGNEDGESNDGGENTDGGGNEGGGNEGGGGSTGGGATGQSLVDDAFDPLADPFDPHGVGDVQPASAVEIDDGFELADGIDADDGFDDFTE